MREILFSIGEFNLTTELLVGLLLTALLCWLANGLLTRWIVPRVIKNKEISEVSVKGIKRQISFFISLFFVLISISFLGLNQDIFSTEDFSYRISHFIALLMTIQGMRVLFWFVTKLYIHDYYSHRDEQDKKS